MSLCFLRINMSLSRVSEVITPQFVEKIVRDINDDAIIATAVAGRADYLVTLDKDMLIKKIKSIVAPIK